MAQRAGGGGKKWRNHFEWVGGNGRKQTKMADASHESLQTNKQTPTTITTKNITPTEIVEKRPVSWNYFRLRYFPIDK